MRSGYDEPMEGSSSAAFEALNWEIDVCHLCQLSGTRTLAVPGDGSHSAELMFIGEGPGFHEDRQGRPFVGAAGSFLTELLTLIGLSREQVFITNVVKCRPPGNRDPLPLELAACRPYLDRQIEMIDPRVIVTLGRHSLGTFFPGEVISRIHGTIRTNGGRHFFPMYHPAAALHQPKYRETIMDDMRKLGLWLHERERLEKHTAEAQLTLLDTMRAPAAVERDQAATQLSLFDQST